jgi:hypothetical protein
MIAGDSDRGESEIAWYCHFLEVLFFKGLASGAKKLFLVTTQDNVVGEETGHGGSLLRASLCASRLCVKKNFCARKRKMHSHTKPQRKEGTQRGYYWHCSPGRCPLLEQRLTHWAMRFSAKFCLIVFQLRVFLFPKFHRFFEPAS